MNLANDPWLNSLSSDLRKRILDHATLRDLPNGALIFDDGDPAEAYHCLLQGEVRISKITSDGRQSILAQLTPPHWFGELSFLDGLPRDHAAFASGRTRLASIAKSDMQRLLEHFPEFYKAIVLQAARHMRMLYAAIDDYMLISPESRLAKLIALKADGRTVFMAQDDLARSVGVSRQSINKILGKWEKAGRIKRGYGQIEVTRPETFL